MCIRDRSNKPVSLLWGVGKKFTNKLNSDGIINIGQIQKIEIKELIDTEGAFLGDSYRLEQLFTNLIENTLRYTDSPGKLEIQLKENKEDILITFSDSEPGVDPDVMDKVFDRFFREELSRSREKGGAGLGLAICHEIIEAHSGTIKATTSEHGGLSIEISLPKGDT